MTKQTLKKFGPRLRMARKAAGMTQQQAASAAGIAVSSWSLWECGKQTPTLLKAADAARVVGVELDVLVAS
tara:strand:- start:157 stop:369 length:213 start_codon:yes stop_codon:yes gene_type:complete